MASAKQQTGMRGVFLVAAELCFHDLNVSPTSRGAAGADLLVTDHNCGRAFSILVKTNAKPVSFWLVGQRATSLISATHFYVLVNIHKDGKHAFYVIPSSVVAKKTIVNRRARSTWYEFHTRDALAYRDAWPRVGGRSKEVAAPSKPRAHR